MSRVMTTMWKAALCAAWCAGGTLYSYTAGAAAAGDAPHGAARGSDADHGGAVVQSTWKPVEIRYSYVGFTTAYNCDAAESKLKEILLTLGAHPQTRVVASGCIANRPSKDFFVTITTATPVAAADEAARSSGSTARGRELSKSERELLDRLGAKKAITSEEFPAIWKTVDLSRDRRLDLQPGDCELMAGLRDEVLPKLSIKVVSDQVRCTPKQLDIRTPELKVSALVPLPSADAPDGAA